MRIASFRGSSRSCVVTVLAVVMFYEAIHGTGGGGGGRRRTSSFCGRGRPGRKNVYTRASLGGRARSVKSGISGQREAFRRSLTGVLRSLPLWFLISPPPCPVRCSPYPSLRRYSLALPPLSSLFFAFPARVASPGTNLNFAAP